MIARRPIALHDDFRIHHRLRSRRHAGRHRARSDRRTQFRARSRGPAAGAAAFGAQPDRRRRPQADRARARGRRPRSHRRRHRPHDQGFHRLLRRPHRRGIAPVRRPGKRARRFVGARLPPGGLHQQAGMAVEAASRPIGPQPALCRDLRRRHVRRGEARSRPSCSRRWRAPAAPCPRPSWSAMPEPTSVWRGGPAFP